MSERKLVGEIGFDAQQGDIHGELQESFAQYLKSRGWAEADMTTRQVTTERVDWLAQLQEKPEIVNTISAEGIQNEAKRLRDSLKDGDVAKSQLAIVNLRNLLDVLERSVAKV